MVTVRSMKNIEEFFIRNPDTHTPTKQTESFKKLPKTVANPPIPKFSDVDGKTGNGDPFYSLSHPSTS